MARGTIRREGGHSLVVLEAELFRTRLPRGVPVRPSTTAELPELKGEFPLSAHSSEENHVVLGNEIRNFSSQVYIFGLDLG